MPSVNSGMYEHVQRQRERHVGAKQAIAHCGFGSLLSRLAKGAGIEQQPQHSAKRHDSSNIILTNFTFLGRSCALAMEQREANSTADYKTGPLIHFLT